MLALALYCGEGDWLDRAVRWATGSRFSHVELIEARDTYDLPFTAPAWSSSWRDNGVRCTPIRFAPGHWEFRHAPAVASAIPFIEYRIGAPYDLLGAVLTHGLGVPWQAQRAWFCSELVAAALGLPDPPRWTPGSLAALNTPAKAPQPASGGFSFS